MKYEEEEAFLTPVLECNENPKSRRNFCSARTIIAFGLLQLLLILLYSAVSVHLIQKSRVQNSTSPNGRNQPNPIPFNGFH